MTDWLLGLGLGLGLRLARGEEEGLAEGDRD